MSPDQMVNKSGRLILKSHSASVVVSLRRMGTLIAAIDWGLEGVASPMLRLFSVPPLNGL